MEKADNQQESVDMKQLEKATNEEAGYHQEPEESEEVEESQASEPQKPEPAKDVKQEQATLKPQESQATPDLKKFLDETPYKGDDVVKSVQELVKGYKELQGRDTQLSQKVKPFEPILDRAGRDPAYAEYLRLATEMYTNPAVAQQYAQPQFQKPDPTQFDLYDPQARAAYDQQLEAYFTKMVDAKLGSRFAQTEQQNLFAKYRGEFKDKFRDVSDDPEQFLQWAQSEGQKMNPYEVSYKLKNWDNREAQLTEKIRKELTGKMDEAAQNKTPQAASTTATTITITDIGKHIVRYGLASAEKKFGVEPTQKAVREMTNE